MITQFSPNSGTKAIFGDVKMGYHSQLAISYM